MNSPVIIFDLGKVLVDFDYSIAAQKIAARSTKAPADLHAFLGSSPLLVQYESGRLTRAEFYEAIRDAIGFQRRPGGIRRLLRRHFFRDARR